ncbi:uncharacterized protein N7518_010297 [Penicillium psychrosexuale]|uniref:uncharacterized protein n=1 Tax=Penicillium psychrosexuale TaxID=1002107 RepID=UPI002544E84C|nr:uncharacterized protein N7518_010297 [Penicillium psychrosexuale]KAJ5781814.1 hypothetical protein N7518_010297 [Penicillium psychrosexuale]
MEPLTTMRIQASFDCNICTQGSIKCNPLRHIQSEIQSEPGLQNAVLMAIPLGKNQFDLAVEFATVIQVGEYFTDLSRWRLMSCDPLFTAELGRSYQETAFSALTQMRYQYNMATSLIQVSGDPRLISWFKAEILRIEGLLDQYR